MNAWSTMTTSRRESSDRYRAEIIRSGRWRIIEGNCGIQWVLQYQARVGGPDAGLERAGQAIEGVRRPVGRLQLEDVKHELVGARDLADGDLGLGLAAGGREDAVGNGRDGQVAGADDHVLQLDAESLEQSERGFSHRWAPVRRAHPADRGSAA